ncbi:MULTISPECIES: FMN-binding negative transcriptional regulator [unclassified Crossiella]|uniref:FMN-binding negative transcriptional regulator n=1 Tax=unclassified Crossiella TaxID=2620835 RepID=UPI001FFF65EF|nr:MULTISPECIES: FMN-binding negative transcriptional regulator [unclassified Crossiella]MCK2240478.1 FMN-binding negative transcriptional regulator [Crossiella sp. S99.2]MCK2253071.1 FMN-binding negative transcriptional regulator [Crossiella sp. S99.1]
MLIHPWDAAESDEQWRTFLSRHDFGELIAPGRGRDLPVVVPTHFTYDDPATVWLHLARPNPVWGALTEHPRCLLVVTGEVAYVRADWNSAPEADPALGVPTSYYATVQLECDVRIEDEPAAKAAILRRQLAHFEPDGARTPVSATENPDRRLLPGIRGLELTVTGVRAKFKFGGNKPVEQRERVAARFTQREAPGDLAVADRVLRRSDGCPISTK